MDLSFYLDAWGLTLLANLAQTPTSHVFKVATRDGVAVLKMLTPLGQKDEINGATALDYFGGHGAVRILKFDGRAQLVNFVDDRFLKDVSTSGFDQEATIAACGVVKKLHSKRENAVPALRSLGDLFSGFLAHSDRYDELFRDGAAVASELLQSETDKVVLHGDLHHKNILESSTEGWLAIDPKGFFGERTFDLANMFYNPDDQPMIVETPQRIRAMAEIFSRELAIPRERILKFAFAFGCLSAYWAMEDGVDPSRRIRIAQAIRPLI